MLTALTLAATIAGADADAPTGKPHYVADQTPAKAITLDIEKVCSKNGYVDPGKLAVQVMVQLKMFDELSSLSGQAALLKFDGSDCPQAPPKPGGREQTAWCNGSIIVQRMLLNVYPGYLPRKDAALAYGVDERDLRKDVVLVNDAGRAQITGFTVAFTNSMAGDALVECDFAEKPKPEDRPQLVVVHKDDDGDPDVMERNSIGADLAEASVRGGAAMRLLQFRQYAGNLVYRGASDSLDGAHATYASGRDLYNTDAGLSFSLDHAIGDEADSDGYARTRTLSVNGVVGIPLCGLRGWKGEACDSGAYLDLKPGEVGKEGKRPTYTWDVVPYGAVDWSVTKTKDLRADTPEKKTPGDKQWEFGTVAYLTTDEGAESCFWNGLARQFGRVLVNCASTYSARYYRLENKRDGSKLDGLNLRYTPLVKTATPGLSTWDVCVNTLCGDPDQMLRAGMLADIRFNHGSFTDRGTNERQMAFNMDYDRIGGRVGAMAVLNALPETPVKVWAAYTNFHAFKGFDRDLGEVQVQASVDFSSMSVALEWRNGRREDTAKRDTKVALSVGFKTK